jgi:hypothetical protein
VDVLASCGEVRSSGSSRATTKNKDPHKCRGATALKVTEGNVRQELGFPALQFLSTYPVFTLAMQQCSSADRSILFTTRIVRSVQHNKERFKCFPKANSKNWSY